jgi:hypothetical protein
VRFVELTNLLEVVGAVLWRIALNVCPHFCAALLYELISSNAYWHFCQEASSVSGAKFASTAGQSSAKMMTIADVKRSALMSIEIANTGVYGTYRKCCTTRLL